MFVHYYHRFYPARRQDGEEDLRLVTQAKDYAGRIKWWKIGLSLCAEVTFQRKPGRLNTPLSRGGSGGGVLQPMMVSGCIMTKRISLSSVSICSRSLLLCVITVATHCSPSSPCMLDLFGRTDLCIWTLLFPLLGDVQVLMSVDAKPVLAHAAKTNNALWAFLLELS